MTEAWLEAHRDLGIEVQIPFTVISPEGNALLVLGLVKYFGNPKGTVLISIEDDFQALADLLESLDYSWSAVNLLSYSKYDREYFIDTLNNWGWYGNQQDKPKWYTGR